MNVKEFKLDRTSFISGLIIGMVSMLIITAIVFRNHAELQHVNIGYFVVKDGKMYELSELYGDADVASNPLQYKPVGVKR